MMDQKSLLVIFLACITVLVGGLIIHDIVNKKGFSNDNTNWTWDNEWPSEYKNLDKKDSNQKELIDVQPEAEIIDEFLQSTASSLEEAVLMSTQQSKPIFVLFSADWCKWCKTLQKDTLQTASVQNEMKKFIYFYVDVDLSPEIAQQLGAKSLPTYGLMDRNLNFIKKTSGFKNESDFLDWIN